MCAATGVAYPEDRQRNHAALFSGERVLSPYAIDPAKPCAGFGDNCLWIAEADRSETTFLLAGEYYLVRRGKPMGRGICDDDAALFRG